MSLIHLLKVSFIVWAVCQSFAIRAQVIDPEEAIKQALVERIRDRRAPFNDGASWSLVSLSLKGDITNIKNGDVNTRKSEVNARIYPVENCTGRERTPTSTFTLTTEKRTESVLEKTVAVDANIGVTAPAGPSGSLSASVTVRDMRTVVNSENQVDTTGLDQAIKPFSVLFVRLSRETRKVIVPFSAIAEFDGLVSFSRVDFVRGGSVGAPASWARLSGFLQAKEDRSFPVSGFVEFTDIGVLRQTYAERALTADELRQCLKMAEGEAGLSWSKEKLDSEFK